MDASFDSKEIIKDNHVSNDNLLQLYYFAAVTTHTCKTQKIHNSYAWYIRLCPILAHTYSTVSPTT